jgi:hypothetical protein
MIMERELWKKVYRMIMDIAKGSSIKRATFSNAQIVQTYLWAVLHDRPISWACDKKNWPIYDRRKALPTPSTMSRRIRTVCIQQLLGAIENTLTEHQPNHLCRWIDAKPLPIGGSSGDRQAGYGQAAGTKAKGYKLYAIADASKGFIHWSVEPMQYNEARVAKALIPKLQQPGYLIGDSAYDANELYDIAASRGVQLLANKRCPTAKSTGHYRQSPHRLHAIEMIRRPFGVGLLNDRDEIDRMFGQLTTFACGLKPLPNWVRTKFRVENWVRGKMIFYNAWRN